MNWIFECGETSQRLSILDYDENETNMMVMVENDLHPYD